MKKGQAEAAARPLALALFSGGGLLLEISLTRLLSTLYYPPYVFAVLSLAVLGIGLGAALATWRSGWRRQLHLPRYMALVAICTLLLLAFAVWSAPFNWQALLLVLLVLPYFFVGLALATLFSAEATAVPRLYLADLGGAGLGALLAVPALNALGAVDGVLLTAVLFSAAGIIVSFPRLPGSAIGVTAISLILLLSNRTTRWLAPDMATLSTKKPIVASLAGGRLLHTTWDAFARTDLVAPADGGPYQLYMDGAAGSVMPPATNNDFLWRDIGLFPFATEQPERVFVIGPGGGLDVWFGLQSNAQEIVAVEVNPASVALVQEFAGYNGDLYGQPGVRLVVDEGRSVLQREARRYDLIFLSQVVTLTAERSGYALVENSTYTVEAFQTYLDHLRPQGQIALKLYDEPTLTRALSTVLETFRRQGLTDAEALHHTIVLLDSRSDPPIPLLIVGKEPFSRQDALSLGAVAQEVGFAPLFLPHAWAEPPLDAVAEGSVPFHTIVETSASDFSPATDDRPFFYQFERGIPQMLRPLLAVLAIIVAAGGSLLLYQQQKVALALLRWSPLYFAALGAGFIIVEVVLIQQVRPFLGHPTTAVTTVLAVLLIGGGAGSGLAGLIDNRRPLPAWPLIGIIVLILAWMLLWPQASATFAGLALPLRVLVVVVALLPLALLMGMPFPLGLRAVGQAAGGRHVALGWAANGIMTVAGSAGAVTLAILAGYTTVLLAGMAAYGTAAALVIALNWSEAEESGKIDYIEAVEV